MEITNAYIYNSLVAQLQNHNYSITQMIACKH